MSFFDTKKISVWLLSLAMAVSLAACSVEDVMGTSDSNASGDSGPATEITWDTLAQLDFKTGEAGAELSALDGKRVKVPGFIVPLDLNEKNLVNEALLVPYFGACIHVPPPPPNQMVYTKKSDGFGQIDINGASLYEPFWFSGTLSLKAFESEYGAVSFTLKNVDAVEPYDLPMPEAPPLDPLDPDFQLPPIDEPLLPPISEPMEEGDQPMEDEEEESA